MAENNQFNSLKEFYPFYLQQHSDSICRYLHFIGTAGFITIVIYSFIAENYWLLLFGPLCGYGFAWIGHYVFEKNKPATFKHPFYSLISDFIMFYHMMTFQMAGQLKKHLTKI
ncbi:MAG: Mpo1-like protein [Crocinitomicaceae bacterium]